MPTDTESKAATKAATKAAKAATKERSPRQVSAEQTLATLLLYCANPVGWTIRTAYQAWKKELSGESFVDHVTKLATEWVSVREKSLRLPRDCHIPKTFINAYGISDDMRRDFDVLARLLTGDNESTSKTLSNLRKGVKGKDHADVVRELTRIVSS